MYHRRHALTAVALCRGKHAELEASQLICPIIAVAGGIAFITDLDNPTSGFIPTLPEPTRKALVETTH